MLVVAMASGRAVAAEHRAKVAMMGLTAGAEVSAKTAATLEELFLAALDETSAFTVTGRSDLQSLLGLERQKQLLGCESDASCMAEIAGALGVDLLASGDVGRLGSMTAVTLKLIDVKSAKVLIRVARTLDNDAALATVVTEAARAMAAKVAVASTAKTAPVTATAQSAQGGRFGAPFWTLAGIGLAAAATGTYVGISAIENANAANLVVDKSTFHEASTKAGSSTTAATIAFSIAGASAVAATLVALLSGPAEPPAVVLAPGIGAVSISGRF